jgi:chitin-binding protein
MQDGTQPSTPSIGLNRKKSMNPSSRNAQKRAKQFTHGNAITPALVLTQLTAAVILLTTLPASAHGSLEMPLSRARICKSEMQWNQKEGATMPTSEGCVAAFKVSGAAPFDDWQSNVQGGRIPDQRAKIPDGLLCSGGSQARGGLDAVGNWVSTPIAPDAGGNITLKYRQTAAHITKYFRTYITNDNYRFDRAIHWDDLTLVGDTGHLPRPAAGNDSITDLPIKIPAGMTGKRVLYTVWQRDPNDNAETFYACADVVIAGKTSAWLPIKPLPFQDIPAGSTAVLRVFNGKGQDVEHHTIKADAKMSGSAMALLMGNKVNAASAIVRIGAMDDKGVVNAIADAGKNQLFGKDKSVTAVLQIDQSGGDVDPVVNRPPVATIGGPISLNAGETATLDASASSDPDGDALDYSWKLPAGVTPVDHGAATLKQSTVSFDAPSLKADASLTFEVTVSDGKASSVAHHTVMVGKDTSGGDIDPSIPAYKAGTKYEAGDKVSNGGSVYQCKPFPYSGWCSQAPAAYEPGAGYAWGDAWEKIGAALKKLKK